MVSRRVLLALCLAAACGKSAEAQRLTAFQETCLSVRGLTYAEAAQAFGVDADSAVNCLVEPALEYVPNASDVCDYQSPVCQAFWSSWAADSDLCSVFGCWFGCEIRLPQGDPSVAVTCMVRFYSGQPCRYGLIGC